MRIAFLTNEFKTDDTAAGGLGTYLKRVTRALCELGHQPEVFVVSKNTADTGTHNGVIVHRVKVTTVDTVLNRAINWMLFRVFGQLWSGPSGCLNNAWHLGRALAAREKLVRFDFVQSTNCGCCGLMVRTKKDRPHIMRMSSKRDLVLDSDGKRGPGFAAVSRLERLSAARADTVYAPSRFIARECTEKWGVPTRVLRPPVFLETQPASGIPFALPPRFMVHTGVFAVKKGTIVLARALRTVWEHAPDFEMIWCGAFDEPATRARCLEFFGPHAAKIRLAGSLRKDILYAVIKKSAAVVLPSLADNLPNAAIESLLLGTPVIGTYGSSIDELVRDGATGLLVARESEHELAGALLRVWNRQAVFTMEAVPQFRIFSDMDPAVAAKKLAALDFEDTVSSG